MPGLVPGGGWGAGAGRMVTAGIWQDLRESIPHRVPTTDPTQSRVPSKQARVDPTQRECRPLAPRQTPYRQLDTQAQRQSGQSSSLSWPRPVVLGRACPQAEGPRLLPMGSMPPGCANRGWVSRGESAGAGGESRPRVWPGPWVAWVGRDCGKLLPSLRPLPAHTRN